MSIVARGMVPLIQVFDMPTSIAFYRDALGFEVIESDRPGDDCDWAMLQLDSVKLMLNTAYEKPTRPAAPDDARVSAHRDTALYFGCPDVEGVYNSLSEKGLDVQKPNVTHYGFKQVSLIDPDGYHLWFHWPEE